ncbi:MarR family winged helix-turn-helix transcriptional regulator [Paenibacillus sp. GCM10023250]|uniref:MarR family winged helix-turn-helix transcriptional regulator n=1 Tax=Paenibacillus sp. GCM10023250 TaxID=3252648 RepID=UPI00360B9E6F
MPDDRMLAETAEFVETFLEFSFITNNIQMQYNKRYAAYGLSNEKFHILFFLYWEKDKALSPSEIADKIKVTRASMTGLIDSLEKEGLLQRASHSQDRRKVTLTITEKGNNLVEKIMPPHYEFIQKVNALFSNEEKINFTGLLIKLLNIMTELDMTDQPLSSDLMNKISKND